MLLWTSSSRDSEENEILEPIYSRCKKREGGGGELARYFGIVIRN